MPKDLLLPILQQTIKIKIVLYLFLECIDIKSLLILMMFRVHAV